MRLMISLRSMEVLAVLVQSAEETAVQWTALQLLETCSSSSSARKLLRSNKHLLVPATVTALMGSWSQVEQKMQTIKNTLETSARDEHAMLNNLQSCQDVVSQSDELLEVLITAVAAVGNLSVDLELREHLVRSRVITPLVQLVRGLGGRRGAELIVANALAALNNCSTVTGAVTDLWELQLLPSLLPLLKDPSNWSSALRAAAVASKMCKLAEVPPQLLAEGGLPALLELARRCLKDQLANDGAEDGGEAVGLGGVVRCITGVVCSCLHGTGPEAEGWDAPAAVPLLVQLLAVPNENVQGNTALCIAETAKHPHNLKEFTKSKAVEGLIELAHKKKGMVQKNAAIALARLSQDQRCLGRIRDLHGIEILTSYLR